MIRPRDWLARRRPPAPSSLDEAMRDRVGVAEGRPAEVLADAAFASLEAVLAGPSTRSTAIDLLAADALLTHACEAAAEADEETLVRVLDSISARICGLRGSGEEPR